MSLKILEDNWEDVVNKVVKPLWNNEFKSMYESAKLDYDDFLSLSGYELSRAMLKFDASKSNIYTFATDVIRNKARTELRDCTKRDKRKALSMADSLSFSSNGEKEDMLSNLSCEKYYHLIDDELTEKRVGVFVSSLSNNQLRILLLKLLDFDYDVMPDMLNISRKTINDVKNSLKRYELKKILKSTNI